jgi:exodeoxyribonuclease-1
VDLAGDMSPLLQLDVDTLRERLFTPKNDLGDLPPVPVKLVHINKCPVLAPASTLRPEDAARLGIDRQHCLANLALLRQQPDVREKLVTLFAEAEPFTPSDDVDTQLYDGFFSDADRAGMNIIRQTAPANLPALDLSFESARVAKLLFRYRARNFPGTLDDAEQQRWLQHRREVLNAERVSAFMQELEGLANLHEADAEKVGQLKALYLYAQELVS